MTHLLIIGGSDAGISAELRARELDSRVDVTLVVADSFPNYSICGIPFYLSGEVPDWRNLAHRTVEEIADTGINLLLNHTATTVDATNKSVKVVNQQGQEQWLTYDKLVIGTGAVSVQPRVKGLDIPGVFLLHSMDDTFAVQQYLTTRQPQHAVIVGGGYIGLEMADALTHRGIAVTVVEHSPTVMKTVDPSLGQMIAKELHQHQIEVVNSVEINSIEQQDTQLTVSGSGGFHKTTDMVLVAVGVKPLTDLATSALLKTDIRGAIHSNQTSKPLSDFNSEEYDVVISLCGCGVNLPEEWVIREVFEDWELDDPEGEDIEVFRNVRNQVKERVAKLIESLS